MEEEVFSSDESSLEQSDHSSLITDEDFSDALFHNCDVLKTGKVEVSALIEILRFSTDQIPEVQNEIGELAKLLDPDDTNVQVDIQSYRVVMADWIQRIKARSEGDDSIALGEDTPTSAATKTSTPSKTDSPLLNMMTYVDGAGDGYAERNELQEKVEDLQYQNQRLVKEVATLRSELESSEETIASKTSQIDTLNKNLRIAQQDAARLKTLLVEHQELKSTLETTEVARQQAQIDLSHTQKDKISYQQKVAKAEEELYQTSEKLEEIKKANQELLKNFKAEKLKLDSSRIKQEVLEKQLCEERSKIEELLTMLEDVNKINEKLKNERSELKVQLTETRTALDLAVLQADVGVDMVQGSDEEDEPMPLKVGASIALEIKSRLFQLGSVPQMPLPLCGKAFMEDLEGGRDTSSTEKPASSMDLDVADILRSSHHMALLPANLEELAAYMEQRKVEVLERMSALTGLGTGTNDTGVAAVTDHQTTHQAEIARFAEKIAAICTAKLVSDTKLANLTGALKNMKEQQSDIEERHQRALEEIQASSDAIQGALLSQVEQLQQEKLQLEETVSTLVRRCNTVPELLAEKEQLQQQLIQLESANAELTDKYKKAEDLMNDSDDELDKNKKDKKEAQKTQQSKGLPLTRTIHSQESAGWKQDHNQQHSPSSPLIDALTLDFSDALPTSGGGKVSRRKEGCISADSILDGHDPDYDGNGNLEYDQGKLLANSCPHLSSQRAGLVTSGTQTDCPEYVKPRPPAIGATKYAVVNTSTGSSTSGVVDLDISSGSNKSEPHGVIKKSVLIVETACSPDTLPSSPEDPYDPLCRYRTSSFKRAIERGPSGDSSNQSFETADPASTSPDLTPDRPYLPPFPAVPGARDSSHLQPPPYREPSPDSKYSGLHHQHSGHGSLHHANRHHGDTLNVSTGSASSREHSSGTTSGVRDTSTDPSWTSPGGGKDHSSEGEHHHRKFRSSTPENCSIEIQEASPTTATAAEASNSTGTGSTAATQDGRQSPQFLRRLSTLVEEGSDAEAEESLLSPKMRSGVLSQPGRRPPRLLDVPSAITGSKPLPPPQYKNPPGYQEALQSKRDASPRSEHRNSPLDMKPADSSVYQPLDQAEPPTSLTPLVSPKAIKADRSPVSPGSLGMPCKRTIFPPPRSALSPSREEPSPSKAELGEDNEIRPSSGQEGSRRGRLQETRKTRDALFTIGKDGEQVDLVSGPLEEVELSEADKLLNAQLLEEARKTSVESRHKGRRLRKGTGSDLTRSQTFDDGEGEDLDEVFKSGTCPSTSAATPTDHAPLAPPVTSKQSPQASREENLAKKRSLTKQSTMPELAETVESDTPTAITPASRAERPTEVMNHHGGCPSPGVATRDGASPMTAATAAANSAFPSLPDDTLKQLGLFRQKGDSLHLSVFYRLLGEQFTDQEIEEKFASLALAFKTDKLTLEKRIDLHERARDIAEQNVNREIDGLKEAMKTLSPFCTDAASRDIYTKVQHHVEVLEQSTSRVSSRAEVHGAVQQELRMSKAIEVMVNHVENLKRLYDKEHQELEETKKLLTENKVIGQNADGDGLQKRSYSLAGGGGLKLGGRRRASVAAFPRKLSMLGAGSSNAAPDHPMDPKTRFQTLIADTAMKTSVVEQLRRSVSIDHQPVRPTTLIDLKNNTGISKPQDKTISATSTTDKTTEKGGKASLDSNSNIDQEAVFQKGYEEGLRAKVGAELTDLRHQQRAFYDNLEKLIDENEVTDEEEQKLGPSWVEVVWQLWPGWSNSGKKLRLAMAGFIFMLAFLSLLMTLMPVGHASERHFVPFSWTSIDEFLKAYGQLRHFQGEPGYRRGPPV